MKTILQQLYNSNILTNGLISEENEDYKTTNDTIVELLDKYKETFQHDQYKQVEDLLDILAKAHDIEASHSFCYGFKLGTLIMIDVFSSKNELIRD